jgi:hypothetical protein
LPPTQQAKHALQTSTFPSSKKLSCDEQERKNFEILSITELRLIEKKNSFDQKKVKKYFLNPFFIFYVLDKIANDILVPQENSA